MTSALGFTVLESGLSALLSTLFGALLARGWVRLDFSGKSVIESLLFLPFFLPPLLIVLAVLRFFGSKGLGFDVYGLLGIVLAHVLLNTPLVFYFVLQEWRRVPQETVMVAHGLGAVGALIEKPVLKKTLPQVFWLVFLYSALSFTIVLTLGGGPNSTTIELAIYQAIRYDFDVKLAAQLSLVQAVMGMVIIFLTRRSFEPLPPNVERKQSFLINDENSVRNSLIVVVIVAFVLLPIVSVFASAVVYWAAFTNSITLETIIKPFLLSFGTAIIFALLVLGFAILLVRLKLAWASWLIAAISPLVIATAVILILRPFVNPFSLGLPLIIGIQVVTLSPLFVRLWGEVMASFAPEELDVLKGLTANPWTRIRVYYWPRVKAPVVRIFGLAMALALGDLALYPLMAPVGFVNLPMLIWQLMSSYQIQSAIVLSVLLSITALLILLLGQVIGSKRSVG